MWTRTCFHKRFTSVLSGEHHVQHYVVQVVHMSYEHYYYYYLNHSSKT